MDAVVAREVTARFCAGDNIIRAEGISGVWEGNREHGRATVLEGANHAAEGRDDETTERSRKVLLYTIRVIIKKKPPNNGAGDVIAGTPEEFRCEVW